MKFRQSQKDNSTIGACAARQELYSASGASAARTAAAGATSQGTRICEHSLSFTTVRPVRWTHQQRQSQAMPQPLRREASRRSSLIQLSHNNTSIKTGHANGPLEADLLPARRVISHVEPGPALIQHSWATKLPIEADNEPTTHGALGKDSAPLTSPNMVHPMRWTHSTGGIEDMGRNAVSSDTMFSRTKSVLQGNSHGVFREPGASAKRIARHETLTASAVVRQISCAVQDSQRSPCRRCSVRVRKYWRCPPFPRSNAWGAEPDPVLTQPVFLECFSSVLPTGAVVHQPPSDKCCRTPAGLSTGAVGLLRRLR